MNLTEFSIPLKSTENLRFSDNFRGIEVNKFAEICLILEVKFGDDPQKLLLLILLCQVSTERSHILQQTCNWKLKDF